MGHFGRNVCHFTNCIRAGFFPIKNPLESGVVIYSDQFRIWGCLTFCFVKVICTDRDFIKSIRDVECVIRGIFKLFHWRSSNLRLTSNSMSDSDIMEMCPETGGEVPGASERCCRGFQTFEIDSYRSSNLSKDSSNASSIRINERPKL